MLARGLPLTACIVAAVAAVAAGADPCARHASCAGCIASEGCGQCLLPPITEDGRTTQHQICASGNATGPTTPGIACATWSIMACHCPLDCSARGQCDPNGVCACISGWGGIDCSDELKPHGKPAVLIPLALLCALIVVGLLIAAQFASNSDRCFSRRHPKEPEERVFRKQYDHPVPPPGDTDESSSLL